MTSISKLINLTTENKKIVFFSVAFGLIVVESFFIVQLVFVLKHFKPQYLVVPTLLGLTIGLLLASILILRRELSKQADIFHAIADQAFEFSFQPLQWRPQPLLFHPLPCFARFRFFSWSG